MRLLRTTAILTFCFVLLSAFASAQQPSTNSAPPSANASLQNDPGLDLRPRTFFGELITGKWNLSGELGLEQSYDDNILSSAVNRTSDLVSRPMLRVGLAVQKKRFSAQFNYSPSYSVYSKYSDRNSLSQSFSQSLGYKVSAHTDLNWVLSASRQSTNSATNSGLVDFGGAFVPVFQPEELQSNTITTGFSSIMSYSHQLSAQNSVSASVNTAFTSLQSDNGIPLAAALANKNLSAGVNLSWDHQFVPGKSVGLQAGESYFAFLNPSSHSNYQFVKVRYSQRFAHGFNFSVGAGPSYSTSQAQTFLASTSGTLSYAVDASLAKTMGTRTMGASYVHGSQPGSIQGSITSDALSAFLSQNIGRKWSAHASVGHSLSNSPGLVTQNSSSGFSASGGLAYSVTHDLNFTANYSYLLQTIDQPLPGYAGFDHNVFSLGLRYSFHIATER